ncbi:MAG: hypothetical protein ACK40L_19815 [Hydrogenophaga sp.]
MQGSYVWDNVVLEDGVTVEQAVICSGAIVRQGATVVRARVRVHAAWRHPRAVLLTLLCRRAGRSGAGRCCPTAWRWGPE